MWSSSVRNAAALPRRLHLVRQLVMTFHVGAAGHGQRYAERAKSSHIVTISHFSLPHTLFISRKLCHLGLKTPIYRENLLATGCYGYYVTPGKALRFVDFAAQSFDQAIQLIERGKLNRQLAHILASAVAFDLLFHAHFHLRHQQI